jgi:23S rRNA pseudouridine2605 synthase
MRLNAFLARAGMASRRDADELIKNGRITIDGQPGQLNSEVSDGDQVKLDGKPVQVQQLRYVLLNKPAGAVTTLDDPQGRKKVVDLINIPERVVPVGRLDYNTTGVLLLTNDGELAHKLMHPSFTVDKVYEATVRGSISQAMLNMLSIGVKLEDGMSAPAKVRKLADNKIELIIHEGRKHQVKRMLAAVGLDTIKLHRSGYANLTTGGLKPSQWRDLSSTEAQSLQRQ